MILQQALTRRQILPPGRRFERVLTGCWSPSRPAPQAAIRSRPSAGTVLDPDRFALVACTVDGRHPDLDGLARDAVPAADVPPRCAGGDDLRGPRAVGPACLYDELSDGLTARGAQRETAAIARCRRWRGRLVVKPWHCRCERRICVRLRHHLRRHRIAARLHPGLAGTDGVDARRREPVRALDRRERAAWHQAAHAEMNVTVRAGMAACDVDLSDDLVAVPASTGCIDADVAGDQAGVEPASVRVLLRPPVEHDREAHVGARDGPVQLRHHVVERALEEPLPRVCIDLLVRVEATDLWMHVRAPGPDRADAHLHPRLDALDGLVHLAHVAVDVLAPPVTAPESTTRGTVARVARGVGEVELAAVRPALAVGREVVVDVNAVDVVPANNIRDDLHAALADRILARIHPQVAVVALHEIRFRTTDVRRGDRSGIRRMPRAVRIEPRMQLEAARMRLANREL